VRTASRAPYDDGFFDVVTCNAEHAAIERTTLQNLPIFARITLTRPEDA